MKTRDFIRIAKQLLPQMPGFTIEKRVIFKLPLGDFLRGVYFESSVDADRFYLSVFFLPLFVPTETIHGTFSKRIGCAINWRADNPNLFEDLNEAIQNEAMPFIGDVATLNGALEYLTKRIENGRPRVNSHTLEALAYGLIKNAEYQSARESLVELKQMLERDTISWLVEQRTRVETIEQKLSENPELALTQLEMWKTETIKKLGFEKYYTL